MIIKGMRWGYDGGGMGCGPVEGSFHVEIMVVDGDGFLQFVEASQFMEYFKMQVSPYPLFDILMHETRYGIDFRHEFEKAENMSVETYDYEMYNYPEDLFKSKFLSVFKLAHRALELSPVDDGEEFNGAQKFISQYLNQDADQIENLELPEEDETVDC